MNYSELFEKNILDNETQLISVLRNKPSIIRGYVEERLSIEGKTALDSTAFRKIVNFYKEGVEDGRLNLGFFKNSYSIATMYDHRDKDSFVFFEPLDFMYLVTGFNLENLSKKEQSDVLVENFLNENKTNFKLTYTPAILHKMLSNKMKDILIENLNLEHNIICEEYTLVDYFFKSGGLMSMIPHTKIRVFLEKLIDENKDAYLEIDTLTNNYGETSISNPVGQTVNKLDTLNFQRALWEIVFDRGLEYMLSKETLFEKSNECWCGLDCNGECNKDETKESESFEALASSLFKNSDIELLFGNDFMKKAPQIMDLMLEINQYEKKFNKNYSYLSQINNSLMDFLLELAIKKGTKISFRNKYALNKLTGRRLLNAIENNCIELIEGDFEEILKQLEKEAKLEDMLYSPETNSRMINFEVETQLIAIFGDIEENEDGYLIKIYDFINKNKEKLFILKEFGKENKFLKAVGVTTEGRKMLVELKNKLVEK